MRIEECLEIFLVTYNRSKFLDNTFKQIFSEESPIKNCQITILDNASTDDTDFVIKNYQKKFNTIRHICHNINIGGSANAAKAFELAHKEYFWILCDDDEYNWDAWYEVENAIKNNFDAIVIAHHHAPYEDIAHLVKQMTFIPATIYKRDIITDEVMYNIEYLISTMFPHFGAVCEIINSNKKVYVSNQWIVNWVGHGWIETYTRNYTVDNLHPYMKRVFFSVGYITALQLIKDKNLRNNIISKMSEDLTNESLVNGLRRLVFMNKTFFDNSFKNICDAFCGLGYKSKIVLIYFYILSFVPKINILKNKKSSSILSVKKYFNYRKSEFLSRFFTGKKGIYYTDKYKKYKESLRGIKKEDLSFGSFLYYQKIRLLSHVLLGKKREDYIYKYEVYKRLFRISKN